MSRTLTRRGRRRARCHTPHREVPVTLPAPYGRHVVVDALYGLDEWTPRLLAFIADLHPGDYRLVLKVGQHHLTFGPDWAVDASPELVAALEPFGRVQVLEARDG